MKDIKFRVWNDKMRKMYYSHTTKGGDNALWSWDAVFKDHIYYPDTHLMQYTGLKDCNDTEIYEGDIVRFFADDNHTHTIHYKNGCFGYDPDRFFGMIPFGINDHFEWDENNQSNKVEVIGNIHENPELLDSASPIGGQVNE